MSISLDRASRLAWIALFVSILWLVNGCSFRDESDGKPLPTGREIFENLKLGVNDFRITLREDEIFDGSLLKPKQGEKRWRRFSIVPIATQTGQDTFSYKVVDSEGAESSAAVVQIEIKPESSPVKIAFFGDHGTGASAERVFRLVKEEGANILAMSGDFDYDNNPPITQELINTLLGDDFPVVAVVGNRPSGTV